MSGLMKGHGRKGRHWEWAPPAPPLPSAGSRGGAWPCPGAGRRVEVSPRAGAGRLELSEVPQPLWSAHPRSLPFWL